MTKTKNRSLPERIIAWLNAGITAIKAVEALARLIHLFS
jgi:hypothetical protein